MNIGILLHKQATLGKHFRPECISFKKHQDKTYSISPFLNSGSVIAFPVQPLTPLDWTPEAIPPAFTADPALSTANVDS